MKPIQRKNVVRLACALALLFAASVSCHSLRGISNFATLSQPPSLTTDPEVPVVRVGAELVPLDDPQNEYRDQYQDWDRWAWEHRVSLFTYRRSEGEPWTIENVRREASTPTNWREMTLYIDEDGCMIPFIRKFRQGQENWKLGLPDPPRAGKFYAEGYMDPDLHERLMVEKDRVRASISPPVPNWLVSSLPKAAMFMPNGDIVTKGELGSAELETIHLGDHLGSKVVAHSKGSQYQYYRYSSAGEKLGFCNGPWWRLYLDPSSMPATATVISRLGGILEVEDSATSASQWLWFDGRPLAESEAAHIDRTLGQFYSVDQLIRFAKYQN